MSIAKELLKKEEKYTEIQTQLEESTKKILAEYAKYREKQELLHSDDQNIIKASNEISSVQIPLKEGKNEIIFGVLDVLDSDTNDISAKTTSVLMKNFQAEILNLKNELTVLKVAQGAEHEKYRQLQISKDKLAGDIIKLNNQNNALRNNLKEKDLLCSEQKKNYEIIDTKHQRQEKELDRIKGELKTSIASEKLCKDQMQRIKKLYEELQIKSKTDQQNYKNQQAITKQVVADFEKRLREQQKLLKSLVSGISQQQLFIGNLQRQTDLLAALKLTEISENNFRELLNLYTPEGPKPTP